MPSTPRRPVHRGRSARLLAGTITPRQLGKHLFALLGRAPRFKHVPVAPLDAIIGALGTAGRVLPALAAKAELARIGRYYATECWCLTP